MYAIQQMNGKFIVPKYFWGTEPLPTDITVSARPKLYETAGEAQLQADRAEQYVLECLNASCERKVKAEAALLKAQRKMERAAQKVAESEVLPYVQVKDKMVKLEKELSAAWRDIQAELYTIEDAKRNESRWARVYDQKFYVVAVGMSVDKVAV